MAAADAATPDREPLYTNLGTLHLPVTTRSPEAQKYFDQGLRLTYAFNHAEAIRSYQQATELDPGCAMCHWGIALALGPNINWPMEPGAVAPAWAAITQAKHLAAKATPKERAFIQALATRYSADTTLADRVRLDSAYARAMKSVLQRYPDDPDVGTLYAEAMLVLRPWNQWTRRGKPQPGTLEVVAALERVIAKHPNHPGACHFYLHTVEASPQPEKALACAERLPGLMPGAGHLVHMPAHIALRLGRYQEAAEHNRHAVHADLTYLDGPHSGVVYPLVYLTHNYHFLSCALALSGQGAEAIAAARQTAANVPLDVAKQMPPAEYFLPVPYYIMVRFERWDDLLREPAPDPALVYTTAMWHYGRGVALARTRKPDAAEAERVSVNQAVNAVPEDAAVGNQSTRVMLSLAATTVAAEIAAARGDVDGAAAQFKEAIRLEDGLRYDEPPPWIVPSRQLLGELYLKAGRPPEAEKAFREDLAWYRENGWSLHGLAESLKAQGRTKEADQVLERFRTAWSKADYDLGSR
jgi:tetratricopeptide (TPR) repeat protein